MRSALIRLAFDGRYEHLAQEWKSCFLDKE